MKILIINIISLLFVSLTFGDEKTDLKTNN